jgi:two-component system, NtrC family, response regulator AtoC
MSKGLIVSVDDDSDFQLYLSHLLRDRGYSVETLPDGKALLSRLKSGPTPSLILMDVMMPEDDGIQIIEKIRSAEIQIPVIMISGGGLVKSVVEAMKVGATDFLVKPFDEIAFETAIENALEKNAQHTVPPSVQAALQEAGFVTANEKVFRLSEIIRRVAATDVPILILGESGVGKEVMARYAHARSDRDGKPFVKVNCAAIPDDLLESELFGYERGAFTGALVDKPGKFEQAHTGTLLLDEIGEMSPHLQSKLLHVLQDGIFTRLGGRKTMHADARIIATTNIKMGEAIAAGRFREDLYFRLNVISIDLPPLRDRREDIAPLCDFFMAKYRERYNPEARVIPAELLNAFMAYDWPGNIRELENCIKRFLVLPNHHSLFADIAHKDRSSQDLEQSVPAPPESLSLLHVGAAAADSAEKQLVEQVLKETNGNRKQAAKRMNICYKALLNKLKRWAPPETLLPRIG